MTPKIGNGGEKNMGSMGSYKKTLQNRNHIEFHLICCFPKGPKLQQQPQRCALSFIVCRRSTSVLSRARETTLKPNMCSSPFITPGCLVSTCVPPLLQSILFNSLGPCLVNKICTFLQVLVFSSSSSTFEQD